MDRRRLLAATGAALLGAPFLSRRSQAAAPRTILRFVPQTDLVNMDPIWGTSYSVRNAGLLVWDTLYGVDDKLAPQRQMVESEEVSADGLVWTFRLRPGLKGFTTALPCWRAMSLPACAAGPPAT